jgi:hypothetical protein
MRHNRPKKKEKTEKTWENEFNNLRDTYGFSYKKERS